MEPIEAPIDVPDCEEWVTCGSCAGTGVVDSGGQTPWGEWIDVICPECQGKRGWVESHDPMDDADDLRDMERDIEIEFGPQGRLEQ